MLLFLICFQALSSELPRGVSGSIYDVFRPFSVEGRKIDKDYYLTLGGEQGLKVGDQLEVLRRMPSWNALSEQLQEDIVFPIAYLQIIHVQRKTAVARLKSRISDKNTPGYSPREIMVGDIVHPRQRPRQKMTLMLPKVPRPQTLQESFEKEKDPKLGKVAAGLKS